MLKNFHVLDSLVASGQIDDQGPTHLLGMVLQNFSQTIDSMNKHECKLYKLGLVETGIIQMSWFVYVMKRWMLCYQFLVLLNKKNWSPYIASSFGVAKTSNLTTDVGNLRDSK